MSVLQLREYLLVGGILAGFGFFGIGVDLQLLEEDIPQLFGRRDVKLHSGKGEDLLLQGDDLQAEFAGILIEGPGVDAYTRKLHIGQYRHQGHLQLIKKLVQIVLSQKGLQEFLELEGEVSILAGIILQFFPVDRTHGDLVAATGPDEFFRGDLPVAQICFAEIIQIVFPLGLKQVVGQHGVKKRAFDFQSVLPEHQQVIFDVLACFQDGRVPEDLPEFGHHLFGLFPVGRDQDAISFMKPVGKGDTDQFCRMGVEAGGFGVEAELLLNR